MNITVKADDGPHISIVFSALAPDISHQVFMAGWEFIDNNGVMVDRLDRSITLLYLQGCLTEAEKDRARRRLTKMIRVRKSAPEPEATQ